MTTPPPPPYGGEPQTKAQRAEVPPQYAPPYFPHPGPPPAAEAPKQRGRRVLKALGVLAFGLVMFVFGVAVGTTAPPPGPATSSTASSAAAEAEPDRGQRFVAAFKAYPGLSTTMSDSDLITLAEKLCDGIDTPGMTRDMMVTAIGTSKLGPTVAPVLVDTAHSSYCPEKSWGASSAAGSGGGSPAEPAPPVEASGPRTTFGAGTYEVGTDIAPGKYKTTGPEDGSCYWARLKNTDGDFDSIITNGNTEGPTTVTISKTDGAFETTDCTWTKAD